MHLNHPEIPPQSVEKLPTKLDPGSQMVGDRRSEKHSKPVIMSVSVQGVGGRVYMCMCVCMYPEFTSYAQKVGDLV